MSDRFDRSVDVRGGLLQQAVSIVMAQADCSAEVAFALVRERANRSNRTLESLAEAVIGHRVWFDRV